MIKANLTWSAAAKFYIWAVTIITALVADRTDLPDWVAPVVAVLGAGLGWAKSQQPVTKA